MGLFFTVISVEEALEIIRDIAPSIESEEIAFDDAAGRVLAEAVFAGEDIPGFDRSVKDGYAVSAADTVGASESMPVALRFLGNISMGSSTADSIEPGTCRYIPTGAHLPAGADAVVMAEYTEHVRDEILIRRPVAPGENMLGRDEDYREGEMVFAAGRILSPQDIGVLAALGRTTVAVKRKPVIGIIATGVEIVAVDQTPRIGEVRDVNTSLCRSFSRQEGAVPKVYGVVRDDPDTLTALLRQAVAECDAVVISGGSSKDERDITARAIAGIGEVLVHGVAFAPGKPTIIGQADGTVILGVPGHPASTYVVLTVFGRALIHAMLGVTSYQQRRVRARLTHNVHSEKGREEYLRVRLNGGTAEPLFGKSGLLHTIVQSDGLVQIPAGQEGHEAGQIVEVLLW